MIQGNSILVVVPARGGSKGVTLKNLQEINNKSLVEITADLVSKLEFVDKAVLSTDHPKIADIGRRCGLDVPFLRPSHISHDTASDVEVLTHALQEVENSDGINYDIILMLQPTSPFRTKENVVETVGKLINGNYDSAFTISQTDSKGHPLKQIIIEGDNLKYYDDEGAKIVARQQLSPVYHKNGVAYAMTRRCLLEQKTVFGKNCSYVLIEGNMVNIDTESDLELARYIMRQNKSY